MQDLKQAIKQNVLVIGTDRTMKKARDGSVSKIYLASNCSEETKQNVDHYAKIFSFPVVSLDENSEELGSLCKKSFSISVASIQ